MIYITSLINYYIIYKMILNSNKIPSLITSLGLAFLTILVPLAIAILLDYYQKRRNKNEEFINLDLRVILNKIFQIKKLIFIVLLIFIPMIFWEFTQLFSIQILEILISVFVFYLIIIMILKIYYWIIGDVHYFRLNYLKSIRRHKDLLISWNSVWKAKNIYPTDEKEFFDIFLNYIENNFKKENENTIELAFLIFNEITI